MSKDVVLGGGRFTPSLGSIKAAITNAVVKAMTAKDDIGAKFNRGDWYNSPADWYNHRSRTFLKNKRKGY